jgi:MSHA biogenesis protein MshO
MADGVRAMKPVLNKAPFARGFTMIELIIVVVIGAVIAVTVGLVVRPAANAYLDSRVRADLSDQADSALRRMLRDIRQSVPNSIRMPNTQCFELVPTSTGGRYRTAPDLDHDQNLPCTPSATCSAPLDTSVATTVFDTLTTMSTTPAVGDWVVINNQNTSDVYAGSNRARITNVAASPLSSQGVNRITIDSTQFSPGYDGGRFQVVPNAQQAVFYVCSGADGTLDASGNGKGVLYRVKGYGFNAGQPAACQSVTGADVVASNLTSCAFIYDPNQGATQQSGFMWLQLTMSRNKESATLAVGAHVLNTP